MGMQFFKPYKGPKYDEGICGKKILVLGASFYCTLHECKFFEECTNYIVKDSGKFDTICPYYNKLEGNISLSDEPSNAIDNCIKVYKTFAKFMQQFINDEDEYAAWERMAFTNYVQFFLPTTYTYQCYLSERDFKAFCETLLELQPDVVIAWGVAITKEIREKNPYVSKEELDKLPENNYYVWRMELPGVDHKITIINCYHPSSKSWREEEHQKLFMKHLKNVLYN